MDLSAQSKSCPFCQKDFKKLGNHLKYCKEQNGRDYEHLLSEKTLLKKSATSRMKKETCPNCGRKFECLSTHLRSSATCKITQTSIPTSSATTVHSTSPSQQPPLPKATQTAPPHNVTTLPRMKLPQTADGWAEANEYMHRVIVPSVVQELGVNAMNHVLCYGIYSYFTSKYGIQQPNKHHQHKAKVQRQSNELKQVLIEKNTTKKRLRQMRRNSTNPDEVKLLAREFHNLVRTHSQLNKIPKGSERNEKQKQQRKDCHKDIHKFARKILNEESYTSIEPAFSQQEAYTYFTNVYSASPKSFTTPSWMPAPPAPSVALDTCDLTLSKSYEVTTSFSESWSTEHGFDLSITVGVEFEAGVLFAKATTTFELSTGYSFSSGYEKSKGIDVTESFLVETVASPGTKVVTRFFKSEAQLIYCFLSCCCCFIPPIGMTKLPVLVGMWQANN